MSYIKHEGREGMQWGVQNGPPYPLENAKSMGEKIISRLNSGIKAVNSFLEENEKKRINEIKLSNDAKIITNNLNLFSTQELRDAVERQRMIKEIKNNVPPKREGFIKKTLVGISNGLSSKLSNAIVDKLINKIVPTNTTYSFDEAKKLIKDYKEGAKEGDVVKTLSAKEVQDLFNIINQTNNAYNIMNKK